MTIAWVRFRVWFIRYKWVLDIAVYLLLFGAGYWVSYAYQTNKYERIIAQQQAEYASERERLAKENALLIEKEVQRIQSINKELKANAAKESENLRKQRNEVTQKKHDMRSAVVNRFDGVRNKDNTNDSTSETTGNHSATTTRQHHSGATAELSRQNAEFLIEFAADAEMTNQALKSCVVMYNDVADVINKAHETE